MSILSITDYLQPTTLEEYFPVTSTNIGQLSKAMMQGTLSNRILISGPTGCGKTTLSMLISSGINCQSANTRPCGSCATCKDIQQGRSFDIHLIDSASSGVNEMRALRDTISLVPVSLQTRVIILDESHTLTRGGQSQLLKILDGYSKVQFIFCTTEPEKMNEALVNRCQHISLHPLSDKDAKKVALSVKEKLKAEYDMATVEDIVKLSRGIPRQIIILSQSAKNGTLSNATLKSEETIEKLYKKIHSGTTFQDVWKFLLSLDDDPELVRSGLLNQSLREMWKGTSSVSTTAYIMLHPLEPSNPKADMMLRIYEIMKGR